MSGILINNLSVKYDDKVIFDGFDLKLEEGKISVILGGSGVGKTTLLNAIAGLKEEIKLNPVKFIPKRRTPGSITIFSP